MNEREILQKLVDRFRWSYLHYDVYVCPACGTHNYMHKDSGEIKRINECSPSCIWRKAEEVLDEKA